MALGPSDYALPPVQRIGHGGAVLCAALDKRRGLLVTGGKDCLVKCFDVEVRASTVGVRLMASQLACPFVLQLCGIVQYSHADHPAWAAALRFSDSRLEVQY